MSRYEDEQQSQDKTRVNSQDGDNCSQEDDIMIVLATGKW